MRGTQLASKHFRSTFRFIDENGGGPGVRLGSR
jgi:hypothetical protein